MKKKNTSKTPISFEDFASSSLKSKKSSALKSTAVTSKLLAPAPKSNQLLKSPSQVLRT